MKPARKEEKGTQNKMNGSSWNLLRKLCDGDENMERLLSYFILLEPKRQIPQLSGLDGLVIQAETALRRGYGMRARVYFETAAKVGIYEGDEKTVQKMLTRAHEAFADANSNSTYQEILSQLPRLMNIAKSFYSQQIVSET